MGRSPSPVPQRRRRSRTALLAAVASTAVACGGTITPAPDASTPEDGGDDATADGPVPFDAGKDAITVKDAFIADDGFCCPLYGGSPKP